MKNDDDIEILDIFDNSKNEIVPKKKEVSTNKEINENIKVKSKKKKLKKGCVIQALFCGISALFIIGCCIFYGSRLIKYYRIYNPKIDSSDGSVLLAQDIVGRNEYVTSGAGLYSSSGNYIYKGDVNNNYLKYNNLLWRILRINADNTIDIILDDYSNILSWDSEVGKYSASEINTYLNDYFIKSLDKNVLAKVNICDDVVNDLNKITCEIQNNDEYVKLLDINNFLNSVKDKKSYLVGEDEIFWLSNYSDDKVWHTNGINVSQSTSNKFYEIKPVVRLKNTVTYSEGDGTVNNPYIVDKENKLTVGSIVNLDDDKWVVYEINDNVKLMSYNTLEGKKSFDKKSLEYDTSSLKEYLNTTYLDSLSYKDKLVSTDWFTGEFKKNFDDVKKDKVTAKVAIPNILDNKFNSKVDGYYTSTVNNDMIWVYENP